MDTLNTFLSEQTVRQIGWVLVHFLWQGCAVGAVWWGILKILGKASSNARYLTACIGLILMALAPVITFTMLGGDHITVAIPKIAPVQVPAVSTTPPPIETQTTVISYTESVAPEKSLLDAFTARLESALPFCVIGWIIGVAALSIWYLGGWCQLQRLRRIGTKTVADAVSQKTSELAGLLGVKRAVRIAESALVQVPAVIGWLAPVILLPAAALTGLDEIQLKAMIAHELAHIKRCDYGVNIAQTVVEILGFYHPAVWWMSRQIRTERENCCDDLAIGLLQSPKDYARALFSMEEIRAKQLTLAVAANGAPLTNRIARLIGPNTPQHPKSGWIPSVIAICLIMGLLIPAALTLASKQTEAASNVTPDRDPGASDPIENSEFTATLPNGVTVELVGLGTAPWEDKQQWWKPDGTNLNQPVLKFPHLFQWKDQPNGLQFACTALCKFSNYTGKEITVPEVKFSNEEMLMSVWGTDFTDDGYEMTYIASNPYFETVPDKTDMRLAVGSKDFAQAKRMGNYTPKQHQTYSLERNRDWVILHPLRIGQQETPCVDLTCKQENKEIEFRVFAKLKNGETERWYFGGGIGKDVISFQSMTKRQNTTIEDIEDIIIEFRPYEWVTFKNVSLRPGGKTDVKVPIDKETEAASNVTPDRDPGASDPIKENSEPGTQNSGENEAQIQKQVEILQNTNVGEREQWFSAVKVLVEIGSPAVPAICSAIRQTDKPQTQSMMALTLRAIGDPAAVPALIDALEKSGFSSDYGVGKPDTEAARFIHKHQMDPSRDGIGLGCPEREITIALERLTGHTEGHDHFYAYDEMGNRLGNYTVTPEIRDRQKEHRKQVAQRWRLWWQNLQQARTHEGGILAAPEGSMLEFFVLPEPDKQDWPRLTPDDIARYRKTLQTDGPYVGSIRGDDYQWAQMEGDLQDIGLIVETYQGQRYAQHFQGKRFVLYAARAAYAMYPDGTWGVKDIIADSDNNGRPAIRVVFDPAGAEKFKVLTENNINRRLAIAINSKVISAPKIMTALSEQVMIVGNFTKEQIEEIGEKTEGEPNVPAIPAMPGGMGGFGGLRQEEKINFSDKSEIDQLLQEQLNTSIDLSPLKGGVPLSEAIEYIRNSVDPPLPIVVDWDELKEKGGILPTDKARPGSYTKAPIHDALRETLYYVSKDKSLQIRDELRKAMYKDIPLSVEFVIENNQIFIKYNPYNLVRKTYTLRPELNYDAVGTPSKADDLRDWIIKEIWPLIDPEQKQRKGRPIYPEISLEDGGILNVTTTEEAHKEIAEKLDKLEPFDLKQIAIEAEKEQQAKGEPNMPGMPGMPGMPDEMGGMPGMPAIPPVGEDPNQASISIEARFILVDDSILQEISVSRPEHIVGQVTECLANSMEIRAWGLSLKPIAERDLPFDNFDTLDDLQASFIIKATQAHKNAKLLTAPKVIVLNGESASVQVTNEVRYIDIDDQEKDVSKGVVLDILPVVQNDGKEILLKAHAFFSDILETQTQKHNGKEYQIPTMQIADIPIHTLVNDRQTILITGPELTAAPKDPNTPGQKQRLLILLKPTVVKHEEVSASPLPQ
jgi:beta-lactamase regulating signal transducer with metallopeptidase domain